MGLTQFVSPNVTRLASGTQDRDMAMSAARQGRSPAIHPIWFGSVPGLGRRLAKNPYEAQ